MTLNEILKSKGLDDETIKTINTSVDEIIAKKVLIKDEEIKKLQGDLEVVNGELTPFKQEKRTKHISSLVAGLTSEDKIKDALKLSDIKDEDDDEAIKKKVAETIKDRPYLQKDAGIPVELKDTNTQTLKKETTSVNPSLAAM